MFGARISGARIRVVPRERRPVGRSHSESPLPCLLHGSGFEVFGAQISGAGSRVVASRVGSEGRRGRWGVHISTLSFQDIS